MTKIDGNGTSTGSNLKIKYLNLQVFIFCIFVFSEDGDQLWHALKKTCSIIDPTGVYHWFHLKAQLPETRSFTPETSHFRI